MKAKDIKALIKAMREQRELSLTSFRCDTMTKEQIHYFKEGIKAGFDDCIFILEDELGIDEL